MTPKRTISNFLILICIFVTGLVFFDDRLFVFGMNNFFLEKGLYHIYIIQFFTGSFLHGSLMHIIFNSIFLYFFGNIVEGIIGMKKFVLFFVFVTIFNGVLLSIFSTGNVIGISGFCMALISYYTLELRSRNNPEYKGGITAIILNIGIGLMPGISMLGHLFGAIAGILFYLMNKNFFKEKWVGEISMDIEKS